jgi:hypothetical protein
MQDHVFFFPFPNRGRAENTDITEFTTNYPHFSNLFVPPSPESSRVSGDNPLEMSIQRYCTSYRYSSIYLFAWLARRSFQGLGWPGIGMSGPYGVSRCLVLSTSPRAATVRFGEEEADAAIVLLFFFFGRLSATYRAVSPDLTCLRIDPRTWTRIRSCISFFNASVLNADHPMAQI